MRTATATEARNLYGGLVRRRGKDDPEAQEILLELVVHNMRKILSELSPEDREHVVDRLRTQFAEDTRELVPA